MTEERNTVFSAERRDDGTLVVSFRPPSIDEVLRGDTVSHLLASQRELLLAARSLLDGVLARTENPDRDAHPRRDIDVD